MPRGCCKMVSAIESPHWRQICPELHYECCKPNTALQIHVSMSTWNHVVGIVIVITAKMYMRHVRSSIENNQ